MADYYIDFNRGSDGNLGTSVGQAWKNLSKIDGLTSAQMPAGSTIRLAADSEWAIRENRDVWQQVKPVCLDNGTQANPLTITSYGGTTKPKVNYKMFPLASWWVWDAAVGAWYFELSWNAWGRGGFGVVVNGVYAANIIEYIKTGLASAINTIVSTNGVTSDTLRFCIPGNFNQRLYLAGGGLTSAVNPTAFFGADKVEVYCGAAVFLNKMTHTHWDAIEFEGGGFHLSTTIGAQTMPGNVIRNCHFHDVGGVILLNGLAGIDSDIGLEIHNNLIERTTSAAIRLGGATGTATGSIHHNHFSVGNLCESSGGFVYLQLQRGSLSRPVFEVHNNYAEYAVNGVGERRFDGCCYYADYLDDGSVFRQNIAAHSFKAFQLNSAGKNVLYSNIAYDCGKFASCTDAESHGGSDYTIVNNLWLSSGRPDTYRCGDQEGPAQGNAVIHFSSTGAVVENTLVANNQFIARGAGWSSHTPVMAYQATEYSGGKPAYLTVQTNSFVGFSGPMIKDMTGTGPNRGTDRTALFPGINVGGSGSVVMRDDLPVALGDAACFAAGTDTKIAGIADFNGRAYYAKPSIGPFEAVALAEL